MVHERSHRRGFYRLRGITERHAIISAGNDAPELHSASGIHPAIYVLVTNRFATYRELKSIYTIDEVLDMYEMAMTMLYNKFVLTENKH